MADLKELKKAGEDLLPIIKDLFDRSDGGKPPPASTSELAVVNRLLKQIEQAGKSTAGDSGARAASIIAARQALTEILIQAAEHSTPLQPAQRRLIDAQRTALKDAYGLLMQRTTFDPIVQLLTPAQANDLKKSLAGAKQEIQQRQTAKKALDTTVKVVVALAKIVAKVA